MWFCIDKKVPVDGYKASGGEEGNGNAPMEPVGITFYYKIAEAICPDGYLEYTLARPESKGWVRLVGQVADAQGEPPTWQRPISITGNGKRKADPGKSNKVFNL